MCKWSKQQHEDGKDERNKLVDSILKEMKTKLGPPKTTTVRWNHDLQRFVEMR